MRLSFVQRGWFLYGGVRCLLRDWYSILIRNRKCMEEICERVGLIGGPKFCPLSTGGLSFKKVFEYIYADSEQYRYLAFISN